MSKFWDTDESVSDFEMLSEEVTESQEIAEKIESGSISLETPIEEYEDIQNNAAFELDERETNVVFNARLRLAQARLYEMLINHDMFEGVEEHPEAVRTVQEELKSYVVERLEVLLGIREEAKKQQVILPNQFNHVEVGFLKELSFKGTNGASAEVDEDEEAIVYQPEPIKKKSIGLKPLSLKPTVNKLKSRTTSVAVQPVKKKVIPEKPVDQRTVVKKSLKPKEQKIVKRKNNPNPKVQRNKLKSGVRERGLTAKEAEEIARRELAESKKKKPFHKMTAAEKAKEIRRVNDKYSRKPDPQGKLPAPSPEQLEMMYATRQARHSNNNNDNFNNMLANMLANKKRSE